MAVLIITGGPLDDTFAEEIFRSRKWDCRIAADSGAEFFLKRGLKPDLAIGDFDSLPSDWFEELKEELGDRMIVKPKDKDETDTELALLEAFLLKPDEVVILGALGGRMDHLLGNVGLLLLALKEGVSCSLIDPKNRIRMLDRGIELKKNEIWGNYVSLLPYTPVVSGLTLRGFCFDVADLELEAGRSRTLSNELKEESGTISFTDGLLLLIESSD